MIANQSTYRFSVIRVVEGVPRSNSIQGLDI